MSPSRRRTLLYGIALVLAAGLLVAGFVWEATPDPGTWLGGAATLHGLGQTGEAIELCRETIREYPDCIDAYVYLATFLAKEGNHEEALDAYDRALEHVGDSALRRDLILDRASVLLQLGRREEFGAARRELAGGEDYRSHVADGLAAAADARWKEAAGAYRRALALRPDDVLLRSRVFHAEMERGRGALAGGRFAEAREAFDAARLLFPTEREAHLQAAAVRLREGEPLSALEVLRELRPDAPGVAELIFDAATALVDSNRDAHAFRALSAAVQADGAGVRELLRTEPAWAQRRGDPRVLEILAITGAGGGAGLTASE